MTGFLVKLAIFSFEKVNFEKWRNFINISSIPYRVRFLFGSVIFLDFLHLHFTKATTYIAQSATNPFLNFFLTALMLHIATTFFAPTTSPLSATASCGCISNTTVLFLPKKTLQCCTWHQSSALSIASRHKKTSITLPQTSFLLSPICILTSTKFHSKTTILTLFFVTMSWNTFKTLFNVCLNFSGF